MKKKPISVKETRYEYVGNKLNSWFKNAPVRAPGRDTMWAMTAGDDGRIYIGLCSEILTGTAALAVYDPKGGRPRIVCDLTTFLGDMVEAGRIPHSKIHYTLSPAGRYVWFGTHVNAPRGVEDWKGPVGRGPMADPISGFEGGRLMRYDTRTGKTEDFGVLVASEGIRCLHLSADGRHGYGITYPKVRLFMRDLLGGETYVSGRLGRKGGIDVFVDPSGKVWGVHDGYEGFEPGQFYYFDPSSRRMVDTDVFLPSSGRYRMSFPQFGNHVLHLTPTPDGQAIVSSYGESRIALFDPKKQRLYDWGPVWRKPPVLKGKQRQETLSHSSPVLPYYAWCPVFDKSGRTIDGKRYDRLVWYGDECFELIEDVRLCAIAYNHDKPQEIVKILFGTPKVGKHAAGHWMDSARGRDGTIYFADRVRLPADAAPDTEPVLRLAALTPPKDLGPLEKV